MSEKRKLNGWMRLWIGISGIWVMLVLLVGISNWLNAPNDDGSILWVTAVFALLPPALLFGIGHLIAWIRRGF